MLMHQSVIEPTCLDNGSDQDRVWHLRRCDRTGRIKHHPDFLAGRAQLTWMKMVFAGVSADNAAKGLGSAGLQNGRPNQRWQRRHR